MPTPNWLAVCSMRDVRSTVSVVLPRDVEREEVEAEGQDSVKKWSTNGAAKADSRAWKLERLAADRGLLELANMLAALRMRFGH